MLRHRTSAGPGACAKLLFVAAEAAAQAITEPESQAQVLVGLARALADKSVNDRYTHPLEQAHLAAAEQTATLLRKARDARKAS